MRNKQLIIKSSKNGLKKFAPETFTSQSKTEPNQYMEKLRMFHFYSSLKDDNSRAAKQVLEDMKKTKNLSYINTIEKTEKEEITYYNPITEINKNYTVKQIEPTKESKRVGLLGYKVGMTGVWDRWGTWLPLTVIKIDRCQVTQVKTEEKDKYYALQIGVGENRVPTRPMLGHFLKHNIAPKKHLKEFRITKENILPIGFMLNVRHFIPGQYVDIKGTSKGKGWAGVMKRWNFGGGFATHGNSKAHRSPVIKT
jgi:hypothetical protein